MNINIPVSIGEVFDKLSINWIKQSEFKDVTKKEMVTAEISAIEACMPDEVIDYKKDPDFIALLDLNYDIWEGIEKSQKWIDKSPKGLEEQHEWNAVYSSLNKLNNERFKIKRRINERFNSAIGETKSHL